MQSCCLQFSHCWLILCTFPSCSPTPLLFEVGPTTINRVQRVACWEVKKLGDLVPFTKLTVKPRGSWFNIRDGLLGQNEKETDAGGSNCFQPSLWAVIPCDCHRTVLILMKLSSALWKLATQNTGNILNHLCSGLYSMTWKYLYQCDATWRRETGKNVRNNISNTKMLQG